ncbi:hypothetical protein ACG0Z6_06005 [Roseateles sp. BYS180W]|uniref:VOC domain-containing protein n=1 Tax=Roseateles rivi TaxID=3299028 RepID=A0ABW7FU28_9BURK
MTHMTPHHSPSSGLLPLLYGGGPAVAEQPPHLPLPDLAQRPDSWAHITTLAAQVRAHSPLALLGDFLQSSPADLQALGDPGRAAHWRGVHHVALYLGDYDTDTQWLGFMAALQRQALALGVSVLDSGPSYIAPKRHGTQGWWTSLTLHDGSIIELFSCRLWGAWAAQPPLQRCTLMSHAALGLARRAHVLPTLQGLAATHRELEVVAYTEGDELGHCYGHLLNHRTQRVLELVHAGAAAEVTHG